MEFSQVVKGRRSVRQFLAKDIPKEVVNSLTEAAIQAPSGGNVQPWRFFVLDKQETIAQICDLSFSIKLGQKVGKQEWIAQAPLVIVACVDYQKSMAKYGEMGRTIAVLDVAAAIENLLLAAVDHGLGACWVYGFDQAKIRRLLNIPAEMDTLAVIPIGYPQKIPAAPSKRPAQEVVHYEAYSEKA